VSALPVEPAAAGRRVVLLARGDSAGSVSEALVAADPRARVQQASRLVDALPPLVRGEADCLVVDLRAGGLRAVRAARSAAPGVPVVALAGDDAGPEALAAVRAGVQECVARDGLSAAALARAIAFAVERTIAYRWSLHDELTGLPTRALMLEHIAHGLARRGAEGSVALLFLDLDDFKPVNDALGHAAGDAVLAVLGQRIAAAVRPGDAVARWGGDEFTVLCEDARGASSGMAIGQRVLRAIQRPLRVRGSVVRLGASIGVAIARAGVEAPEELVERADRAMYVAKRRGGGLELARGLAPVRGGAGCPSESR
jgi:diguanylate cyclase (GGDEF)-like protein